MISSEALAQFPPEAVQELERAGALDHLEPELVAAAILAPAAPVGLTVEDLRRMSPEAIVQARAEGRLDHLLLPRAKPSVSPPDRPAALTAGGADQGPRGTPPLGQLTERDLVGMSTEEIHRAYREGRCDTLMGRRR